MARCTIKAGDDYALHLSKLLTGYEETAKKAIYAGAEIVADAIKENLDALPDEEFRRLKDGEKFDGVPPIQKKDLVESFGITPIERDKAGDWNAKVGFDGYGSTPTKAYPKGVPNQLIARAIESGSSVRQKHPFVAPAVRATRKAAQQAMGKVIDEEFERQMRR